MSRGGFTLIEMIAVVVLIALLYAVALPNLGLRGSRELDDQAEMLRADLELARQSAIATGTRHRLALDLDASRRHLERWDVPDAEPADAGPRDTRALPDLSAPRPPEGRFAPVERGPVGPHVLPERVWFERVETAEGVVERGTVGVEFAQDGSASPAVIRLANDRGDALSLEVLPLADTVRIHAVP